MSAKSVTRIIGMASLALLCAGCAESLQVISPPPPSETKRNTVEQHTATHDVFFHGGSNDLPETESEALRRIFASISPLSVRQVMIEYAPGQGGLQEKQRKMTRQLRAIGFTTDQIAYAAGSEVRRDQMRLLVSYAIARPPAGCPDWSESAVSNYDNTMFSNYSCATMTNLGHMVANPNDLLHGRGKATVDAGRSAKAIKDWREGTSGGSTAATTSSTSSTATTSTASGTSGASSGSSGTSGGSSGE